MKTDLVPAVVVSAVAINTTPAEKTVIAGLLVMVPVVLAVLVTEWRDREPDYT